MFADVYVEVSSDSNLSRKFLNERETFEKRKQSQIEEESQVNSDLSTRASGGFWGRERFNSRR